MTLGVEAWLTIGLFVGLDVGTKGKMEKPVAGLQRGCAIAH